MKKAERKDFGKPDEVREFPKGKLEAEKKILAGGLPVGDRAFVFMVEAASNDEVDQLLQNIPMWGSLDWEVTPLQTFAGRADMERAAIKAVRKASK